MRDLSVQKNATNQGAGFAAEVGRHDPNLSRNLSLFRMVAVTGAGFTIWLRKAHLAQSVTSH